MERDFSSKGVKFYYIYKALAHPENNGYVTPFNLKERLMHVAEAKRTLGSRIPWICDSMDNDLKHALGDRPNSEFVIDPDGKIVVSRSWSSPASLRNDLDKLVGKVESPTTIADLNMKSLPPPQKARTGVVPRVELPGQMSPLITHPQESKTPHYAKLRAESGNGKLYLGFFLDPLYKVHWNNKAPALKFKIEEPAGVTVTPNSGEAAKVEIDADADPREFLVEVTGRSSEPLKVTVSYFACDDAETFCVPVTQEYEVSFDRDRDGGSRRSAGGRGGRRPGMGRPGAGRPGAGRPGTGGGGRQFGGQGGFSQLMARLPVLSAIDSDRDGKISEQEMKNAPQALQKLDSDGDGQLSGAELAPRRPESPRGR